MSSVAIYNLVRALTKPYVGAHIEYKGEVNSEQNIESGKVLQSNENTIIVKTYDGNVRTWV